MNAGKVDVLVIVGGNPVYTAPVDLEARRRAEQGAAARRTSVCTTMRPRRCATGRSRRRTSSKPGATRAAYDGTVSIVQPLIAPLYGGQSAHEVLAAMSDRPERSGHDIVRDFWAAQTGGRTPQGASTPQFEADWRRWLHDGVMPNTRVSSQERDRRDSSRSVASSPQPAPPTRHWKFPSGNDPSMLDGRFANNGWLQELPKPITQADLGQRGHRQPGDGGQAEGVAVTLVPGRRARTDRSATSSS